MEYNCREMKKKIRDRYNFDANLKFLREYNKEEHLKANGNLLRKLAYRFSLWEERYVFTLENRYETFRENVVWLDYDEILEMYLKAVTRPNQKETYWDNDCYRYFRKIILMQINKLGGNV